MNKLANNLFTFFSFGTIVIGLVIAIAWLFDSTFINLCYVFKIGCNCVIISFLFYLLFGGKRN